MNQNTSHEFESLEANLTMHSIKQQFLQSALSNTACAFLKDDPHRFFGLNSLHFSKTAHYSSPTESVHYLYTIA